MQAFVTAETGAYGLDRLRALGLDVVTGGWGATRQPLDRDAFIAAARGATILITEIENVDAAVLDALPSVRFVATARGDPVNVNRAACAARGIEVVWTPARNAESVADFTIGLMVALSRGIAAGSRHLREDGWLVGGELPYLHFRGPELAGRRLGLVGFGAVGRAVARRAQAGFGMDVCYTDPFVDGALPLDELLATSDFVSLHCTVTPETRGLLGVRELALLKPTAYLINTARAAVVDEEALLAAVRQRRIAGVALDVHWTEPLPRNSEWLQLDNALLTPHLAGAAEDVVRHAMDAICAGLSAWLARQQQ